MRGEVAEWLKASVSKTDILSNRYRGFESRPLRQFNATEGPNAARKDLSMKVIPIVIAGFGHVGRAFFTLLREKDGDAQRRYGVRFETMAVIKSDGAFSTAPRTLF